MNEECINIIKRQSKILLDNVQETFNVVTENQFSKTIVKWPIWKHFYHMLHSLDQWFINPYSYSHPAFHQEGINYFDKIDNLNITKTQLLEYFKNIRKNIEDYLSKLNDDSLLECPDNCTFTRLDLIIGQNRHLMYNLGLIHIMLQIETGKLPKYIGMSQPV